MKVTADKIIAEQIADGAWLVMWSDGTVREFQNQKDAEKAIRKSQKVERDGMLVTQIEWRSGPTGRHGAAVAAYRVR